MGFAKHMSAVIVDCVLADNQFVGKVFMCRSAKKMTKNGYMKWKKKQLYLQNHFLSMKRAFKQTFKPKSMFIASLPVRQTGSM